MSRRIYVERLASGIHFTPGSSDGGFDEQDAAGHLPMNPFHAFVAFPDHQPYRANVKRYQYKSSPYPGATPTVSPFPSSPAPETALTALCLPLLKASVEVTVDGSIASTTLIQRFINKSEASIPQANYTFPLYDGAVVLAFKCSVGDDKILTGEVLPKEEARATFKAAVNDKSAAALLEEHTPEIFQTVVGNIPPMTEVEVEIKYVCELKAILLDGRKEGLELILPMSIAPRYGTPTDRAQEIFSAMSLQPEGAGLDIHVKIHKTDSIEGVEPSHSSKIKWNVAVEGNDADSFEALDADQQDLTADVQKLFQIHIHHVAPASIMEEDFIVTIETSETHPLCSQAVLSPTNSAGHAALLVNVKPGELFEHAARPETFEGEIIFVLDQSESMGWPSYSRTGVMARTKIETLRNAMPVVMTSLPSRCAFNILSFGSSSRLLWESGSQPYTESTRQAAIKYGGALQADMGGTELLAALQRAVDLRSTAHSSTQIIVITDGELEENNVLDYIWKTRQQLEHQIRFFALGIGTRVPHRLIGRIGEFGGGYGEVVDIEAHPKWSDRLMRMLHAGIMPSSWQLEFDLGRGFERKSLLNCQFGDQNTCLANDKMVPYVQSPHPTPAMHPFSYRSVFFLLNLGRRQPPSRITLRSTTPGTRTQETRELSVTPTRTENLAILHLAAKSVLVSLDALTRESDSDRSMLENARTNAERLGASYRITSRWTSFVAVDRAKNVVSEVEFHKARLLQVNVIDALRSSATKVSPSSASLLGPMASIHGFAASKPRTTGRLSSQWSSFSRRSSRRSALGLSYGERSGSDADLESLSTSVSDDDIMMNSVMQMPLAKCVAEDSNLSHGTDEISAMLGFFQDAEGIFHPSSELEIALQSHFCKGTTDILVMIVVDEVRFAQELSREDQLRLMQTMMIVSYLQTHHSTERQTWGMMASKARHAVAAALDIVGSEDLLSEVERLVERSAMHAHFTSSLLVSEGKSLVGRCPVCNGEATLEVVRAILQEEEQMAEIFECRLESCTKSKSWYFGWKGLWSHQVASGHMGCTRLEDVVKLKF
ncbi:von Willebrand domain-containing protein [Stagonosporopsis vannaccii]|nr:von Willebrand domain-containing protein [Stagonosporopsis vannaccii]